MTLPTIQLTGTCVDEGQLRFTPTGQAVYQVRVACNNRRKNPQTQEWEDDDSLFIDIVVWGSPAEQAADTFKKGTKVIVTGTLKQESWEGKDGTRRTTFKVTADNIGPLLAHISKTGNHTTGSSSNPIDDPWATSPF